MRAQRWFLVCAFAATQVVAQAVDETRDYGITASSGLRLAEYAAPTPLEVPGARTIRTAELAERLKNEPAARTLLFDVLGGEGHGSLPGAVWLPGAGRGESFDDAVQNELARTLEGATRGDKTRPLVFFCSGPDCWLSYNAALRAVRLGYGEVLWYRGGIAAWRAAGGAVARPRVRWRGL